jgi:hypothetical protein
LIFFVKLEVNQIPQNMTNENNKPATMFWVVGVVALVWNCLGVMAYLGTVMMSPEDLQAMPEAERALAESTPAWATAAFAIAVWGGALGSLLLLLKKKLATTVFMASFAGIVVQMFHAFIMANSIEVYGPGGMVMPIMVLIVGAFLIWYARAAAAKGWLN